MTGETQHRATILTYHSVGQCPTPGPHPCLCVSPASFTAHMEFLARCRQVVSLEALVDGRHIPGPPAVAITFDDGYRDILTNAAPVLVRYGFVATVFVPTGWVGGVNGWDAGSHCYPLEIMDESELREAERHGISVESHGHSHIDLERADPSLIGDDLRLSVSRLGEVLGRRPRYLAYPYGRQSVQARTAARAAGFDDAFLFDQPDAGPFRRERISMDGYEGRVRLRMKTAGGYVQRRRSTFGRLGASLVRVVAPRPDGA